MQTIAELHQAIDQAIDPQSQRYGRLLIWRNFADPFKHYGVGLSDEKVFDTGLGICVFTRRDAVPVIEPELESRVYFPPEITIARLKQALIVFENWNYNLLAWNCEHLSRLIVTDQPRCYQSQPLWWLCGLTVTGDHPQAWALFNNHLLSVGLGELTRR